VLGPIHLIKTSLIENGIKGLNTDLSQAFRFGQYWSNIITTLRASQIELYTVSQDLLPPPPTNKNSVNGTKGSEFHLVMIPASPPVLSSLPILKTVSIFVPSNSKYIHS
jgi:hypothetical protein